ncbi:Tyrosine-protein phosphatase [Madurella mycetomatis]|uniref:Tyrosine-protein phosphatase n=1 Tax=Madurella mycetomatis TaxID=100816 RepID=A0A175W6V6_9PEZI|nr:Tyrosine-protein phosphatase [Madurella mycetomatis]
MDHTILFNLAQTDVSQPLLPEILLPVLQQPPFVSLPGSFNTRDLGLLPGSPIRPGLAYRSGGFLTPDLPAEAAAAIVWKLGIKRIFDLRSVKEHERQPDPAIAGAEVVWTRPGEEDPLVNLEEFVEGEGEKGYANMYLDVLRVYAGAIKAVLEYVRDRDGSEESEAFMFHCAAGRDRTGIVAGLLLTLAGASPETVELDFLLSRIGTEPAREQLMAFAMQGSGARSVDAPGFHNLCNLKLSCWQAFVKAVEQEHGGFEGYVKGTLGFSDGDLAKIRRNLVLEN